MEYNIFGGFQCICHVKIGACTMKPIHVQCEVLQEAK